jgi:hypothetical protein
MVTLFTLDFSVDLSPFAFDLFFLDGWKALIKLSLAMLRLSEHELLSLSNDEVFSVVKSLISEFVLQDRNLTPVDLLEETMSFKVTNSMLGDLIRLFNNDKAQFSFSSTPSKRSFTGGDQSEDSAAKRAKKKRLILLPSKSNPLKLEWKAIPADRDVDFERIAISPMKLLYSNSPFTDLQKSSGPQVAGPAKNSGFMGLNVSNSSISSGIMSKSTSHQKMSKVREYKNKCMRESQLNNIV